MKRKALWVGIFALLGAYSYTLTVAHQGLASAFAYDGDARVVFERRVVERGPFWGHGLYRRMIVREYEVCTIAPKHLKSLSYNTFTARGTGSIGGTKILFLKASSNEERQEKARTFTKQCKTVRVPFWYFTIFMGGGGVS